MKRTGSGHAAEVANQLWDRYGVCGIECSGSAAMVERTRRGLPGGPWPDDDVAALREVDMSHIAAPAVRCHSVDDCLGHCRRRRQAVLSAGQQQDRASRSFNPDSSRGNGVALFEVRGIAAHRLQAVFGSVEAHAGHGWNKGHWTAFEGPARPTKHRPVFACWIHPEPGDALRSYGRNRADLVRERCSGQE